MLTTLQSKARARRSSTATTAYSSFTPSSNPRPIGNSPAQEPNIEKLAKVRFEGLEARTKPASSSLRICSILWEVANDS